jgi:phosphate-selective porin OprO/OprP
VRFLIVITLLAIFANGTEEKIGGQIVFDRATMTGDDYNAHGREVRRVRLFVKGKAAPKLMYEIEYSLTGNNEWKDVYLKHQTLDNLGIQVGNIKEPMGLESLTSSKNGTFMERSLTDTFIQNRKLGILVQGNYANGKHKGTISFGIFGKSLDKLLAKKSDGTSIIGRITYALVNAKDDVIHIGASVGQTKYNKKSIKFSTDAGAHMYDGSLIKSKIKRVKRTKRVGLEAAVVKGAFSFQGEYIAITASNNKNDYNFDGWYGQVSWFATGEHRKYKTKSAKFSRTKIKKHFKRRMDGYWGALEVAFRASKINLSDKNKIGGEEVDLTLGVNYYPRKNIRLISNYTFAEVTHPETIKEHIIQVRGLYGF